MKPSWDWRNDIKKRAIYEAVLSLKKPEFVSDDVLSVLLENPGRNRWNMCKVAQHLSKHPMLERTGKNKSIQKGVGVYTEQVIYRIKR